MARIPRFAFPVISAVALASTVLCGQEKDPATWAALFANHYSFSPDIIYGEANNVQLKLDVWHRQDIQTSVPTVIYIHGGGWVFGAKAGADTLQARTLY